MIFRVKWYHNNTSDDIFPLYYRDSDVSFGPREGSILSLDETIALLENHAEDDQNLSLNTFLDSNGPGESLADTSCLSITSETCLSSNTFITFEMTYEPTENQEVTDMLRRGNCQADLIKEFFDSNILQSDIQISRTLENGTKEAGKRTPG